MKSLNNDGKNAFNAGEQCLDIKGLSPKVREYLAYEGAITSFRLADSWNSYEEMEAHGAHGSITLARREILKLQAQIEKWESVIVTAKRSIVRYKRLANTESSRKPGKPVRSKDREQVVKEFTMRWVDSLMGTLEAKGCGKERGLEKLIPSILERRWRRWLSGETIPSYNNFEKLLGTKITHGNYAGKMLCDVPVYPTHDQILTLLQFI